MAGEIQIVIRASRDSDLQFLAPIYQHSVQTETASWEIDAPSTDEFALRRLAIIGQGFPYLTAELDAVPVGYAYASSYRSREGYRYTVEDSVYVAANQQGRGIGKKLLMALIAECRSREFRAIIAVIGDSDNLTSVKLHASCGFDKVGTFPKIGFKFNRWLDSVQMCLTL